MTSTGLQLCTDGLLAAGILGQGDPISAGDSSLSLRILNQMLESWETERQMIYTVTPQIFNLVPGQKSYQSTSFSPATRPIKIDSLVVSLNNIDYEVEIIDTASFEAISYKLTTSIPEVCSITQSYPILSIDFYPLPYAAFTCTMQVYTALPTTITEATSVSLPPAYEEAIVSNLAVRYAPRWGRQVSPELMQEARQARAVLKRINYEPALMETGLGGSAGQISNGFIYQGWR